MSLSCHRGGGRGKGGEGGVPLLEVIQVDLGVVPGHQPLDLGRGEHVQPLGVDDAAEAPDEGGRLLLDLRVHPEVGHQVDVTDPGWDGRPFNPWIICLILVDHHAI